MAAAGGQDGHSRPRAQNMVQQPEDKTGQVNKLFLAIYKFIKFISISFQDGVHNCNIESVNIFFNIL